MNKFLPFFLAWAVLGTSIVLSIVNPNENNNTLNAHNLSNTSNNALSRNVPKVYGIKQTEEEHVKQGNGSMYAEDSTNPEGNSYLPKDYTEYTILAIGCDKRIGNYVIVGHGKERWVYGHTVTSRHVGEVIRTKNGNVLGQYNKSGISDGPHVHIEKWLCANEEDKIGACKNVSSKGEVAKRNQALLDQRGWSTGMMGSVKEVSKDNSISGTKKLTGLTDAQRKESERGSATRLAIQVIKKYEGFRAKAYKDLGGSGYSIGFGSRSYPGEMISKKEADRRLSSTVQSLYQTVSTDFKLKPEQYAGLISFAYNCHNGYKAVAKDGLQEHPQWCKKACTGNKCTVYPGLVKRRAEEAKLLFQ